jgi:L-lysine 2,3-aminomutase
VQSLHEVEPIIKRLSHMRHVSAVRLRSWAVNHAPSLFSEGIIRRLASMNRLSITNPLRLEIETQFLHASEIGSEQARIARALGRRGITLYCNIPLISFVNNDEEEVMLMTSSCRRLGIEINHMYVAGLPLQREWHATHPIHLSQIIDIASFLRRHGSGRELPRYVIRTELGEVAIGITSQALDVDEQGKTRMTLLPYDIEYYRRMDPEYEFPQSVELDDSGHPIVTVDGLVL